MDLKQGIIRKFSPRTDYDKTTCRECGGRGGFLFLKCDECKGTGKVDYIGRLEKFLSNVDERPKEKTLEELLKRGFINTEIEPIILKAIKIANEMTRPEMEYYKNVIISIANKRVTGRVIIGQLQALIDAMEEQRKINY